MWRKSILLSQIDFSGEVFSDHEEANLFCRALSAVEPVQGLTSIDLTGAGLGDIGLRSLTESLLISPRPELTSLCLGNNRLGDDSLALFINTLGAKMQLAHLDLSYNHADVKSCQAVGDLLKDENCALAFLSMRGNLMKDEAVLKVVDALNPPEFHELLKLTGPTEDTVTGVARPILEANCLEDEDEGKGFHSFSVVILPPKKLNEHCYLNNSTLTSLDLGCNEIGHASYHRLKHAMRDHKVLSHLSLGGSYLTADSQEEFLDSLRYAAIYTPEIISLDLSRMSLDNQVCDALARFIGEEACRLLRLDLSFNVFDANGMHILCEALASRGRGPVLRGNCITVLDLSSTPIGTMGAVALADIFLADEKERFRVKELQISGCGIGGDGVSTHASKPLSFSSPIREIVT